MLNLNLAALLLAAAPQISLVAAEKQANASSSSSLPAWVAFVQRELGSTMRFPRSYGRADYGRDSVEIGFSINGTGRPTGAHVVRTSNNAFTDAAAMQAVERLGSPDPLPAELPATPRLRAILTFPRGDERTASEKAVLRLQGAR